MLAHMCLSEYIHTHLETQIHPFKLNLMYRFRILQSIDFSDSLDRLDVSQTAEAEKTKAALKKMEGDMGDQLASLDLKKEVRVVVKID